MGFQYLRENMLLYNGTALYFHQTSHIVGEMEAAFWEFIYVVYSFQYTSSQALLIDPGSDLATNILVYEGIIFIITVECLYNAIQCNIIMYTILQCPNQKMNHACAHKRHHIPRPQGELWGGYCDNFGENGPCYNGTTLFYSRPLQSRFHCVCYVRVQHQLCFHKTVLLIDITVIKRSWRCICKRLRGFVHSTNHSTTIAHAACILR